MLHLLFLEIKDMAKTNTLYYFDDWKNPPCPSTYKTTTATIVSEARGVTGYVQGSVVREGVTSIEMSFNAIKPKDWAKLISKFSGKRGGKFFRRVHFFDQERNAMRTGTFYISDRESGDMMVLDKNRNPQRWLGASFTLVEK